MFCLIEVGRSTLLLNDFLHQFVADDASAPAVAKITLEWPALLDKKGKHGDYSGRSVIENMTPAVKKVSCEYWTPKYIQILTCCVVL